MPAASQGCSADDRVGALLRLPPPGLGPSRTSSDTLPTGVRSRQCCRESRVFFVACEGEAPRSRHVEWNGSCSLIEKREESLDESHGAGPALRVSARVRRGLALPRRAGRRRTGPPGNDGGAGKGSAAGSGGADVTAICAATGSGGIGGLPGAGSGIGGSVGGRPEANVAGTVCPDRPCRRCLPRWAIRRFRARLSFWWRRVLRLRARRCLCGRRRHHP